MKRLSYRLDKLLAIAVTLFLGLSCFNSTLISATEINKHLLFISSYNMNLESVSKQIEGLKSGLDDVGEIDYIFMDTKNIVETDAEKQTYTQVKNLVSNNKKQYDGIMIGDDAAMRFALKYQQELFAKTPIVYEGIKNADLVARAHNNAYITGVYENLPLADTLNWAKKIYPQANKIVAISDSSFEGIGASKQFNALQKQFNKLDFSIVDVMKLTRNQLKQQLNKYDENTIVIYLLANYDADGLHYTLKQWTKFITDNTNVPIFNIDEVGVEYGFIGGKCVNYTQTARQAGTIMKAIVSGKKPMQLAPRNADNHFLVNQQVLIHFDIDSGVIPNNATLVNAQKTFFTQYGIFLIPGLIILVLLIMIVIAIVAVSKHRKASEQAIKDSNSELKKALYNDNVTGLYNFNGFKKAYNDYLRNHPYEEYAIIYLKLIDYQIISDIYGMDIYHEVLKNITSLLKENKQRKIIGRYGIDDFIYFIHKQDINIDRIDQLCHQVYYSEEDCIRFRMQAGIYTSNTLLEEVGLDEMIRFAITARSNIANDTELSYCFFDGTMKNDFDSDSTLSNDLKEALEHDEFEAYYQPIFTCKNLKLNSFECYAKWIHPTRGIINAAKFIPILEKNGMIMDFDKMVIENALRNSSLTYQEYHLPINVSMNISKLNFLQHGLNDYINKRLDEYAFPKELFKIEIQASAFENAHYRKMIQTNMLELQQNQINFLLDSFGLSSDNYNIIRTSIADGVKINIFNFFDENDLAGTEVILASIINLAHQFNKYVVAINVENQVQYELLLKTKCDYVQGNYFCKSVPYDRIGATLNKYAIDFKKRK